MKTRIVLTGILRDKDLFLVVKRNENDDLYPRTYGRNWFYRRF